MAGRPARYVIAGNGAAGTTCAETLRRADPEAVVTLIDDEPYPLYNRVALPRFLKHEVREERVFMRTIESHAEKGIDLRLETMVDAVDHESRAVTLSSGETLPYDALLAATGGRPNPLEAPGAQGAVNVHNFQFMDETKALIERVKTAGSAVVIGGSYIAYELSEGFAHNGVETTWLMRGPWFLRKALDEDGGRLVETLARDAGVTIVPHEEVDHLERSGDMATAVVTRSGRRVECGMVGVGLGLTYNVELLSGVPITVRKGILSDATLKAEGVDGVWVGGDVAEFFDVVIDRHNQLGTWPNSIAHGKLAARNMMGAREQFVEVPYYASGLFSSSIAVLGLTPEHGVELESMSKLDLEKRHYRRLFFQENRLVGVAMIGSMKRRKDLTQTIMDRLPVPQGDRAAMLEME
ncbi:MAG: NAD(P)/FAD-dependent oxidoreductase [Candidatus Dormibacteria bacterium]